MHIWVGNIVLLLLYTFILSTINISNERKTNALLIVMFCQLSFLYTFKDNTIFNDVWEYLISFEYSKRIGWTVLYSIRDSVGYLNFELGWRYFIKTLSTISNNELFFLFVSGSIIVFSYFMLIKKYSAIPWLSIFLFISIVFYTSLTIIRQYIAIAICLFSIPYIIERKPVKFFLVITIATFFHYISVIFISAYFFYLKRINIKSYLVYISVGMILFLSSSLIIDLFSNIFGKYRVYINLDTTSYNLTPFYISLTILIFAFFQLSPFREIKDYERVFFHMLVFVTIFELARQGLPSTISRAGAYFHPAFIILLPNAVDKIRKGYIKIFIIIVIMVLFFLMMKRQMYYGFRLIF